jgi:hypothetical protein
MRWHSTGGALVTLYYSTWRARREQCQSTGIAHAVIRAQALNHIIYRGVDVSEIYIHCVRDSQLDAQSYG